MSTVSTTAENGDSARQTGGRFAAGNRFALGVRNGKGSRRCQRRMLDVLREEVDEEAWRKIVRRCVLEAQGLIEDVDAKAAREFLARYLAPPSLVEKDQDESSLLLS